MEINPLDVFCLFHQKTDCSCVNPITDKESLIKRLNQEISMNDYLINNETDPESIHHRQEAICGLKMRLKDLMMLIIFYFSSFDSIVNC